MDTNRTTPTARLVGTPTGVLVRIDLSQEQVDLLSIILDRAECDYSETAKFSTILLEAIEEATA
jgi:hypothetical protein